MFAKLVSIPEKYLQKVPSDFVVDAQRIMKLMNPPGPMVECTPLMDSDGEYVMPQWTVHYELYDYKCEVSFCAPFRYLRNLVTDDPDLTFIWAVLLGGRLRMPSKAHIASQHGRYEAAVWKDKLAREESDAKDLSELV